MIRNASVEDLKDLMKLERNCFSESEVINEEGLKKRLLSHPFHTYILEDEDNNLCAYLTYLLSNDFKLEDSMFSDDVKDIDDGKYIIILGLACDPLYNGKGYASKLMNHLISNTSKDILLTCHDYLIPFYERFGFKSLGVSSSSFCNEIWYDMALYKHK